jgi:hypothetical protein
MNVAGLKRAHRRFDTPDLKKVEIQAWGEDNFYPVRLGRVLTASDSGVTCRDRYANFINGDGFKDLSFSTTVVNPRGDTMDDLLQAISRDMADFRGFALHVTYDALARVNGIHHVPFENCRLCQRKEDGTVSHVAIHPDWEGKLLAGGKPVKVTRETVDYLPVFDPTDATVFRQVEEAGGVEGYRGQVLWVSLAGNLVYPTPKYDAVATYMSTEEGIANTLYRNARNGLRASGMLVLRKGARSPGDAKDKDEVIDKASNVAEVVSALQGDVNANNVAVVEVERDDEKPEFVSLRGENYDKEFEVTSGTACERIYAAFDQDVFYRLRSGSSPFSNDGIIEAYEYYNSVTANERRAIERALDRVIKAYHEEIPVELTKIEPLVYNKTKGNGNTIING